MIAGLGRKDRFSRVEVSAQAPPDPVDHPLGVEYAANLEDRDSKRPGPVDRVLGHKIAL